MPDSRYYLRRVSPALRREVLHRAHPPDTCQRDGCGAPITLENFHCAHLRSANHGGPPILENLAAWCAPCNLTFGNRDAVDTRTPLRPWQEEAVPILIKALTGRRVATLMAAPGAGKTIAAGRVFDWMVQAGLIHRLLVVVPKVTLMEQWRDALRERCHIHLDMTEGTRGFGRELSGMDGLVTTIQSLQNPDTVRRYLEALHGSPTLCVVDEVHHLCEKGLWASRFADIVGDVQTGLRAHVLNLSGTLFRTNPGERIATVEYEDVTVDGQRRIQSVANYKIESDQLVKEHILRRPNLYRIGATVDVVNLADGTVATSSIADLTQREEVSPAVRKFHDDPHCRELFVSTLLNKLELMSRDSGHAPVKGLLVAQSIHHARTYAAEVDRQMRTRGLQPLAACVVSDDPQAHTDLARFRTQRRVGVLCTVGMAGEGFDCPDIIVIGYASNIITELFIRQVIARGQRVTEWERARLRRPLSTQVIVPDFPEIVNLFRNVLTPMALAIDPEELAGPPPSPPPARPRVQCETCGTWVRENRICPVCFPTTDRVSDIRDPGVDGVTAVTNQSRDDYQPEFHDHDPEFVDSLGFMLEAEQLPGSDAPAVATVIKKLQAQRPFDSPVTPPASAPNRPKGSRDLSPREEADRIRHHVNSLIRWYIGQHSGKLTDDGKKYFVQAVKNAGGFTKLDLARPDQLRRAHGYLVQQIRDFCEHTGTPLPKHMEVEA